MTMNHPDITMYGTDPAAHRRRMVRDLELFLTSALRQDGPHPDPLPDYREREEEAVYSPAIALTAIALTEDPRC
jgi:hypothetical protein